MSAAPRRFNRLAWLLIALPLGAGALWALVPGGGSGGGDGERPTTTDEAAPPNRAARLGQAMDLLRRSDRAPEAAAAAPDLIGVLFSGDDAPARLGLVLTAIAENPTPPEQDPLWPDLIRGISSLWTAETMTWGIDLMISESRPRAHRAVISSFTTLATSDRARLMTPDQRQLLTNHFIDLYQKLPPAQQPEVVTALRKVGANDAADVLLGKGLESDDGLEINREHKQAIEESVRESAKEEARARAAQAQQAQAQAQQPQAQQPQVQIEAQAQNQAQAAAQAAPAPPVQIKDNPGIADPL